MNLSQNKSGNAAWLQVTFPRFSKIQEKLYADLQESLFSFSFWECQLSRLRIAEVATANLRFFRSAVVRFSCSPKPQSKLWSDIQIPSAESSWVYSIHRCTTKCEQVAQFFRVLINVGQIYYFWWWSCFSIIMRLPARIFKCFCVLKYASFIQLNIQQTFVLVKPLNRNFTAKNWYRDFSFFLLNHRFYAPLCLRTKRQAFCC